MADNTSASIIPLHQPKKPLTAAERAKAYRDRKRLKAGDVAPVAPVTPKPVTRDVVTPVMPKPVTPKPVTPVTPVTRVTTVTTVTPAQIASWALTAAAFGLAGVGVTMNGWFARSLGSSDVAGWLFLAIGVAADLVALAVPSCAARLWEARARATAALSWAIWSMTFAFALTAGIGFASVNLTDVTMSRASRVTPAVEAARADLADAMASRDRECKGGVGKFCREREKVVTERRAILDAATAVVEKAADPQTEAATRMVAWLSRGMFRPSSDDFNMLRLILIALLPQVGGVLLMIARGGK